jgi:hypothetical protein
VAVPVGPVPEGYAGEFQSCDMAGEGSSTSLASRNSRVDLAGRDESSKRRVGSGAVPDRQPGKAKAMKIYHQPNLQPDMHLSLRDRRAFKKMFTILMTQLKLYDVEVSAYRVLMEGLKATGPDIPWEKMLKNIRNRKRFCSTLRRNTT